MSNTTGPKTLAIAFGFLLLLAGSLNASAQSAASIKELSKRSATMPPQVDCKSAGTCDLKSVKFVERKIKVLLPNERAEFASYMTDTRFIVQTTTPKEISRYGIVQYLRGCMFESQLLPDGTVERDFTFVHKQFGAYSLMRHENWVIDSSHADPLATSFESYGRFDLYKWNRDPADLDADNATWYFDMKPPHGTVFKSELLATTGLIEGTVNPSARNSSLELETCLFKIADVPMVSDAQGKGIDKSKAIWCTSWDHKFSYDFANKTVVQDKSIHPFCSEPSRGPL